MLRDRARERVRERIDEAAASSPPVKAGTRSAGTTTTRADPKFDGKIFCIFAISCCGCAVNIIEGGGVVLIMCCCTSRAVV